MSVVAIQPFNQSLYTGRSEPYESNQAQYWYSLINPHTHQSIGLVSFGCDQGVNRNQGRIGAKHAPDAIRQAFAKLPVSLAIQQKFSQPLTDLIGDCGTVICDDNDEIIVGHLENAQALYAEYIAKLIQQNRLAIGLGGGHEIAFGSFMGLWSGLQQTNASHLPNIGTINLDAHFDLRQDQYATSGTPFRQIAEHLDEHHAAFNYLCIGISQLSNTGALFERADALSVSVISDDDCYRLEWHAIEQQILDFIAPLDVVYLTIDMDCLSGFVMPAVSAVAAKGLSLDFVERCVSLVIGTGKVRLIDIAEVNPTYDIDGRGLKVAARLLAVMIEAYLLTAI